MEERTLTEKESLEVITSMIERTKRRYMMGDGDILLLWGYVTIGVTALVWTLLAVTHNPVWNWLWFLIWIIGGIATPVMSRKQQAKSGAKSYSDRLVSNIWSTVGFAAIACTFFCLGFLLVKGVDTWGMMFSFALIMVPFAEIANGIVIREKALVYGGGVGLLTGIYTSCLLIGQQPLYVNEYLPVFIGAFVCMMVIPGHILNHKARKES